LKAMPESAFQSSMVSLGLQNGPVGGAPSAQKALAFNLQHQIETNWCWAAVTASVAAFFRNQGWSQCRLANDQFGQANCCSSGSSSSCNTPWYLDRALTRVGNLGTYMTGAMLPGAIQVEIDSGRPIGARIAWAGGGGHFVAISGYFGSTFVHIEDPWFGPSTQAYTVFRSSYLGGGSWTHSYGTRAQGGQNAVTTSQPTAQCLYPPYPGH
jgi:hypothetical protein